MSRVPFIPLKNTVLVEVLPDEHGIVHMPQDRRGGNDECVLCTVISTGMGEWTATGQRIPVEVVPGETVVVIKDTLAKVSSWLGFRNYLLKQGLESDYIEKLAMVQERNISAKLPPKAVDPSLN